MTKWYVNLPANMDRGAAKNHGPNLRFSATRSGRTWTSVRKRKSKWTASWQPNTHDAYFTEDPSFTHGAEVEEKNNRFVNELKVPPTGGITYTVTAAKAANQGAANVNLREEYEAWRAIYYKVEYMNDRCQELFASVEADFKAAFAPAFIELLEHGRREKCKGPDEDVTIRGAELTLSSKHAGELEREPYQLRILLVNDIAEKKEKSLQVTVDATTRTADVVVENDAVKIKTNKTVTRLDRGYTVKKLILNPDNAAVEVPAQRIVVSSEGQLSANLDTDTLRPFVTAASDGKNVTVTAKVTGRAVVSEDARGNPDRTNDASKKLAVPHGHFWLEGTTVHFESNLDGHVLAPKVECCIWVGNQRVVLRVAARSDRSATFSTPEQDAKLIGAELDAGKQVLVLLTVPHVTESEQQRTVTLKLHSTYQQTDGTGCGGQLMGKSLNMRVNGTSLTRVDEMKISAADKLDVGRDAKSQGLALFNDDGSELKIDLTKQALASAKAAIDGGRKLELELEYEWISSFGGYHTKDSNVLVLTTIKLTDDELAATTKKRMLAVACHETGHAFGLVRESQAKKDGSSEDNASHYTGRGGKGPHCALNTKRVPDATIDEGEKVVPDDGVGKLCIMYHTVARLDRTDTKFCDTCTAHLLRNEVKIS